MQTRTSGLKLQTTVEFGRTGKYILPRRRQSVTDQSTYQERLGRLDTVQCYTATARCARSRHRVPPWELDSTYARIEQRDFVVRNARNLQITDQQDVPQVVRDATSTILACQYTAAMSKAVTYSRHNGDVVCVQRGGVEYSEAHMGFGEGRTQSLVVALEKLPKKSLILVEEPETSLHPGAQYALAKYLMDVSIRRGHQIFLTTHSEYLLNALPAASRLYLMRDATDSIRCLAGVFGGASEEPYDGWCYEGTIGACRG